MLRAAAAGSLAVPEAPLLSAAGPLAVQSDSRPAPRRTATEPREAVARFTEGRGRDVVSLMRGTRRLAPSGWNFALLRKGN